MPQHTLRITGMSCDHCVAAVKEALAGVGGVRVDDVRIGSATVSCDDGTVSVGRLVDAVYDAGYEAEEGVPS
jgi:copper chaperone